MGPGTFDPKQAQEKVIGTYGDVGERVTLAASVMMDANNVPAMNKYKMPAFEVTSTRTRQALIKEESEKQKEQKIR